MPKVTVSHRVDGDLMVWATEYARTRGSTRSVLLEEALRAFRELAEGGVPDLPPEPDPKPAPKRKPAVSRSSVMGERQARLAKELGWGAGPVPGVRKGVGNYPTPPSSLAEETVGYKLAQDRADEIVQDVEGAHGRAR